MRGCQIVAFAVFERWDYVYVHGIRRKKKVIKE